MKQHDPNRAIDYIIANASKYAAAANAREQYAYASPEYVELLNGLKAAVEIEETLKWELIAAQLRVDVWRSQEASNRNQERATQ